MSNTQLFNIQWQRIIDIIGDLQMSRTPVYISKTLESFGWNILLFAQNLHNDLIEEYSYNYNINYDIDVYIYPEYKNI